MSRVAVTVEQFWHKVPGGTARAVANTLSALIEDGTHEYLAIAARHRAGTTGDGLLSAMEAPPNVSFAALPRPILYEAWHRLGTPRVQTIVGGEVDAIWASAMVVPPATAPVVVTVHDLDFLEHPEWLSKRGKNFFPRAWQATKRRAGLIVCPSQTVASACERHGVAAERLRVVGWGVDSSRVSESELERVRRQHSLPDQFVLWVGTAEPRKNLARIAAAVAAIEGLHVVLVGPSGWNLDEDNILNVLGNRAHRLGQVSDEDLRALYGAATVFVFPSLAEGFGLPVLEAMAQATPVVTSLKTGTADAAKGAALLVDPLRTDEIAGAIHSIITDSDLAARLSTSGLKVASDSTWEATALGYVGAFGEVTR